MCEFQRVMIWNYPADHQGLASSFRDDDLERHRGYARCLGEMVLDPAKAGMSPTHTNQHQNRKRVREKNSWKVDDLDKSKGHVDQPKEKNYTDKILNAIIPRRLGSAR